MKSTSEYFSADSENKIGTVLMAPSSSKRMSPDLKTAHSLTRLNILPYVLYLKSISTSASLQASNSNVENVVQTGTLVHTSVWILTWPCSSKDLMF